MRKDDHKRMVIILEGAAERECDYCDGSGKGHDGAECAECNGCGGFDDDVEIPAEYAVCWVCDGKGVHDHEAFSNGISPEDFAEDPDFREDYFAGNYDVSCSACDGLRVVLEPIKEHLHGDRLEAWNGYMDYRSELAQERRYRERGIQW